MGGNCNDSVLCVDLYCVNKCRDVNASSITILSFRGKDIRENGPFMYVSIHLLVDAGDIIPSNNLTVKDELEIVLCVEQKESVIRGLGWKSNSSRRTIRKRKIITMTFSLNGEGAIIVEGWLFLLRVIWFLATFQKQSQKESLSKYDLN